MTEQIESIWQAIAEFMTSKMTSVVVAGTTIAASQAAQPTYINIAESGFLWFTYPHWGTIIGSTWILVLLSKELYKLLKNIWSWWADRDGI